LIIHAGWLTEDGKETLDFFAGIVVPAGAKPS
jgi:hypothetical protein